MSSRPRRPQHLTDNNGPSRESCHLNSLSCPSSRRRRRHTSLGLSLLQIRASSTVGANTQVSDLASNTEQSRPRLGLRPPTRRHASLSPTSPLRTNCSSLCLPRIFTSFSPPFATPRSADRGGKNLKTGRRCGVTSDQQHCPLARGPGKGG